MADKYFLKLYRNAVESPSDLCFELRKNSGLVDFYSHAEFLSRIEAAAACLSAKGLGRGQIVLIFAQHGIGMLSAFFGAQLLGAIPSFMPPPTAKQSLDAWRANHTALIDRIAPALLVAEPDCLDAAEALSEIPVLSTSELEISRQEQALRPVADIDDVAFLQHSSGTTGLKKGVTVTYRQLLEQVDIYRGDLGLVPGHATIVSWLPLYHDMGLITATLMPFTLGVPVRAIDTMSWLADPVSFIDLLADSPNAYAWMPDFAFRYLAKRVKPPQSPGALAGVRAITNCSEPCKAESMEAFIQRFAPAGLPRESVRVCYAMAEYVFAVTQTSPGESFAELIVDRDAYETNRRVLPLSEANTPSGKRIVSVGKPIARTEVRIEEGLEEGAIGEIQVRGPSLCSGYFKNPDLTRERFVDGWYRTGDLGFLHAGELYVSGRKDDMIIVRGRNLYAHDMEQAILAVRGLKPGRAVAFGVDNLRFSSQDVVIAAEVEGEPDLAHVEAQIRDVIMGGFNISPIEILLLPLNTMSKTTSGKISRSENLRKFEDGSLQRAARGEHGQQ